MAKLRGHLPWAVPLLSNMAQDKVVGFVKAMATDNGHDAFHVHLVLLSLTAGMNSNSSFACRILMFLVSVFFVGLVSELVLFFSWDFAVFEALCELVHTQGGQCGN